MSLLQYLDADRDGTAVGTNCEGDRVMRDPGLLAAERCEYRVKQRVRPGVNEVSTLCIDSTVQYYGRYSLEQQTSQ